MVSFSILDLLWIYPLGKTLSSWNRPNGLVIKRVAIPIGVIGVIYESRPNVTSDVSALCFKTGNVVILRGGSEAFHSNNILAKLFRKALKKKTVLTQASALLLVIVRQSTCNNVYGSWSGAQSPASFSILPQLAPIWVLN